MGKRRNLAAFLACFEVFGVDVLGSKDDCSSGFLPIGLINVDFLGPPNNGQLFLFAWEVAASVKWLRIANRLDQKVS